VEEERFGLEAGNDTMIQVSHLTKVYDTGSVKTTALFDVSFEIKDGEFVAIMGPSGSGKSTLMHILGVLDVSTSGTYRIDGKEIGKYSEAELAKIRNGKIGFVFQAYNLLPRTTAIGNVILPMMYGNVPKGERIPRAAKLLQDVGLADRMYHRSNELSGGQQQRVAVARSLAMNPSMILADEPTGNLSTVQSTEIMEIFQTLNHKGHTIVMITHEPYIAEHAKRVIHLKDGTLVNDTNGHTQRKVK